MAENFSDWGNEMDIQNQVAQQTQLRRTKQKQGNNKVRI